VAAIYLLLIHRNILSSCISGKRGCRNC